MTAGSADTVPPPARRGRNVPASPTWWGWFWGENGVQRWVFYLPAVFMVLFLALPVALTLVWSVFERTQFWMEPGFTLFAYETFFTSARAENYLYSMIHSALAVVASFVIGFPIAVNAKPAKAVAQYRPTAFYLSVTVVVALPPKSDSTVTIPGLLLTGLSVILYIFLRES